MKNKEKITLKLFKLTKITYKKFRRLLSKYPKEGTMFYSKSEILSEYYNLLKKGKLKKNLKLEKFLQTKPTRTISGVAPVTVLTKPYRCPGSCIFCPTMTDQPKSYLSSEPGAMRAKMLSFDPYKQVQVRTKALENIGHNTGKIELIILGGTWSYYPKKYQLWFIKECFRAMNNLVELNRTVQTQKFEPAHINHYDQKRLEQQLVSEHRRNESAKHRCVGLVIETRPDFIDKEEVKRLRFLGVTKVQLGVQSLNDRILKLNKRGHKVSDTKNAIKLLRLAGFKLHLHWMLNLYGSTPKGDFNDFKKLFDDTSIRPDELKIYPCLLLRNTKLYELYKKGKYKPYSRQELLELLIKCKSYIPKYCRISRLFRDIPSFEIAKGVRETNFREVVQKEMERRRCGCIRCREIRGVKFKVERLKLEDIKYKTDISTEHFLSYITKDDKLVGFLRLSLPFEKYSCRNFIHEIRNSAMIREVHVYGKSLELKAKSEKFSQHRGIGTRLLKEAEEIARGAGFKKVAVISAVGTREYYRKRGFKIGDLYGYLSKKNAGLIYKSRD